MHAFARAAWPIVEPTTPFIDNWHTGAICEHLEAVSREQIQRLLINVPPGHAKSLLVSVFWPAWVWTWKPEWRSLFSAYASDLAIRDSIRCRSIIESPWYAGHFSACKACAEDSSRVHTCEAWALSGDQNVKGHFTNTRTGVRMSLSVGSKATGFRGDAVVVDDPLNATDAPSKLSRDSVIFWWDQVMSSRLNDPRRGAHVIIMQRLHERDLSGHVLARGGYEHLCLPSQYETKRKTITFYTAHEPVTCELRQTNAEDCRPAVFEDEEDDGELVELPADFDADKAVEECLPTCSCPRHKLWEDPRSRDGQLLFRTLFPLPVLASARRILGGEGYAGQHQQRPAPEEGGRFKKFWWRFWKQDGAPDVQSRPDKCDKGPARILPEINQTVISLDCAFRDKASSDFVVFQVWGVNKADRFLLGQRRDRMSFTRTLAEFRALCSEWPMARRKIVEAKANGDAVIDSLKREIAGIIPLDPEGGKEARAAAIQPQVESGNVYLPDGAPWLDAYVQEFANFPNGENDDQVDCTSQALLILSGSTAAARARGLANM